MLAQNVLILLLLTVLVTLSSVRTLESFVDAYAGVDLSTLSDADRRTLTRAALTQQRALLFNSLTNVTTKLSPNCFDTADAAYNTSACRMSRNARDAEVTKLVSKAQSDFCTANSDCKQAQRSQYVLNTWKTKCQEQSKTKLSDLAFLKQLLTKDNTTWLQLIDRDIDNPSLTVLGQVPITSQDTSAAVTELASNSLATSPDTNIIRLDFSNKHAIMYSDQLVTLSNVKTTLTSGTTALLIRKLGVANQAIPASVTAALTANDGWLDKYYYFQNSDGQITDADRMQKCAAVLSQDDFVLQGKQAFDTAAKAAAATAVSLSSPASASAVSPSTNELTVQLLSDYNTQRAQQAYPKSWYSNWQTVFQTRYNTSRQQYNTNLQLLNSLQTNKIFTSYNIVKTLLDATAANNKVLQSTLDTFDGGTYQSAPYCFPAGLEASYNNVGCCTLAANVKNTVIPYKQYCPEPTSVCARIAAAAGPDSAMFRTCKNYFANQIKINQLNAQISSMLADPTNKALIDSFNTITASNASLLTDLTGLQQVMTLVAKDIAAAK